MIDNTYDNIELETLLKNYGFESSNLTEKEKLKLLRDIIFKIKLEKDYEEIRFSKLPEPKAENDISEYISKINNLEFEQKNALIHILNIKKMYKENRKLDRKKKFQKLFGKK